MVKIGFVTCVQLGLSCMEAIYKAGGELALAITLNDSQAVNKSGRIYLDSFCKEKSIPLFKSNHINNDDVLNKIKEANLDWLFIIGWSQVASKTLIDAPKNGTLGIHPTLLPVGRGRASVPWAIIKNLDKTGVTLFKLDEGVDTGPIIDQIEISLNNKINATQLYSLVDNAHIELIKKVIPTLKDNSVILLEQDNSLASEWPGRNPEEGEINLKGSVYEAEKLVRALTSPYPGAFFIENKNKIIVNSAVVLAVEEKTESKCLKFSDGVLRLLDYIISPK